MRQWTKQDILILLETANTALLFRMLFFLYRRQEEDERQDRQTKHSNGVGFNALDADFLTGVCERAKPYGKLTNNQAPYVRDKLRKYSNQLADIANVNEARRAAVPGYQYRFDLPVARAS